MSTPQCLVAVDVGSIVETGLSEKGGITIFGQIVTVTEKRGRRGTSKKKVQCPQEKKQTGRQVVVQTNRERGVVGIRGHFERGVQIQS